MDAGKTPAIAPGPEDGGLNPVLPFRPCSPEEIQEALLMKEAKAKEAKEAKRASVSR